MTPRAVLQRLATTRKPMRVDEGRCLLRTEDDRRRLVIQSERIQIALPPSSRVSMASAGDALLADPRLVCFSFYAAYLQGFTVSEIIWTRNGTIRFAAVGSPANRFTPLSDEGTYQASLAKDDLTVGSVYDLQYNIDHIPNIDGWSEVWRSTGISWTQPGQGDPPIDEDYEPQ